METPKEYILCAAIWYKNTEDFIHPEAGNSILYPCSNIASGFVVTGYRHAHIIALMKFLSGKPTKNQVQGFITNTNRFVGRKEARKIAFEAGQINKVSINSRELFSEDLY